MTDKDIHLSDAQLGLMRALWEQGEASTSEVYDRVGRPRALAYTTVATLLTRLEARGLLSSTKGQGGGKVFKPLVSESEVTRSMVSSLVETLFRGDPQALVSHLVKEKDIKDGDLDAIRKLLAESKKS